MRVRVIADVDVDNLAGKFLGKQIGVHPRAPRLLNIEHHVEPFAEIGAHGLHIFRAFRAVADDIFLAKRYAVGLCEVRKHAEPLEHLLVGDAARDFRAVQHQKFRPQKPHAVKIPLEIL